MLRMYRMAWLSREPVGSGLRKKLELSRVRLLSKRKKCEQGQVVSVGSCPNGLKAPENG